MKNKDAMLITALDNARLAITTSVTATLEAEQAEQDAVASAETADEATAEATRARAWASRTLRELRALCDAS